MTINCTDLADTIDGWVRINRPSSQSIAWLPPVPITVLVVLRLPVRCSGGAGRLRLLRFQRICAVLGYLHLACGSLPGGCSVFLGFKGGLGWVLMETS